MENTSIPRQDIGRWLLRLREASPSKVLREIAEAYGADRPQLAMMLGDLFGEVSTTEVQMVWHWNLSGKGRGLCDADIDKALEGLSIKT